MTSNRTEPNRYLRAVPVFGSVSGIRNRNRSYSEPVRFLFGFMILITGRGEPQSRFQTSFRPDVEPFSSARNPSATARSIAS